jgi:hypothetical protein
VERKAKELYASKEYRSTGSRTYDIPSQMRSVGGLCPDHGKTGSNPQVPINAVTGQVTRAAQAERRSLVSSARTPTPAPLW